MSTFLSIHWTIAITTLYEYSAISNHFFYICFCPWFLIVLSMYNTVGASNGVTINSFCSCVFFSLSVFLFYNRFVFYAEWLANHCGGKKLEILRHNTKLFHLKRFLMLHTYGLLKSFSAIGRFHLDHWNELIGIGASRACLRSYTYFNHALEKRREKKKHYYTVNEIHPWFLSFHRFECSLRSMAWKWQYFHFIL